MKVVKGILCIIIGYWILRLLFWILCGLGSLPLQLIPADTRLTMGQWKDDIRFGNASESDYTGIKYYFRFSKSGVLSSREEHFNKADAMIAKSTGWSTEPYTLDDPAEDGSRRILLPRSSANWVLKRDGIYTDGRDDGSIDHDYWCLDFLLGLLMLSPLGMWIWLNGRRKSSWRLGRPAERPQSGGEGADIQTSTCSASPRRLGGLALSQVTLSHAQRQSVLALVRNGNRDEAVGVLSEYGGMDRRAAEKLIDQV